MAKPYQPPYSINPAIIRLISDISEQLGRLSVLADESNAGNNTPQVGQQVTPQVEMLLKVLIGIDKPASRNELQSLLSLKDRESFRERYLKPALNIGLIEMTLPDKPYSRLQQYRLTEQGRKLALIWSSK